MLAHELTDFLCEIENALPDCLALGPGSDSSITFQAVRCFVHIQRPFQLLAPGRVEACDPRRLGLWQVSQDTSVQFLDTEGLGFADNRGWLFIVIEIKVQEGEVRR